MIKVKVTKDTNAVLHNDFIVIDYTWFMRKEYVELTGTCENARKFVQAVKDGVEYCSYNDIGNEHKFIGTQSEVNAYPRYMTNILFSKLQGEHNLYVTDYSFNEGKVIMLTDGHDIPQKLNVGFLHDHAIPVNKELFSKLYEITQDIRATESNPVVEFWKDGELIGGMSADTEVRYKIEVIEEAKA